MSTGTDGDVEADAPHVPLVVDEPPLTRDGRPARATPSGGHVSPLRALAGAGVAVAGVALGIGALLTVTSGADPGPGPVVADALPAVEQQPVEVPSTAPTTTAPAPPSPRAASPVPASPRAAAPRRTEAAARPVAARPAVTVLNNSTRTGLADRAAARFSRAGWPVRQTGNFRGKLRATTVYFEPGQRAAAERFASTFRGIPRVLPRPSNIPGPRGLVVVLTRSFPA